MSFNEWKLMTFEEMPLQIIDGDRGKNYPKKEDFSNKGYCLFLNTGNVRRGGFEFQDLQFITLEKDNELRKGKLRRNDIVLTTRGTLGNIGLYNEAVEFENIRINSGMVILRVSNENLINVKFLYQFLKSNLFIEQVFSFSSGSAQPQLPIKDLKQISFCLPDILSQNKIASILSTIDDKIENNLATNQTLEEIARTLFKEWFVNFNYPNAGGNLKHSELGEIPEGWSINGLGEISYVQNGYAFKSKDFQEQGEVGIIKIKNINGNVVDIKNTDFVDASVVSSLDKKFKVESGVLLIAMTGAEVGKIGLVPLTQQNLWLNQRVGMFQEKIAYGNLFMYLLLSTDTYQTAIQNSALGSAQPNISASAIESIRAIIPPADLIEAFGKIVKPLFEKILDNLAENETLKNTRDSLLPKLMSGEIDVKN